MHKVAALIMLHFMLSLLFFRKHPIQAVLPISVITYSKGV